MKNILILTLVLILSACQSGKKCKPGGKCCKAKGEKTEIATVDFDQKLADLNIKLTDPGTPVANYMHVRQAGNILYLAGKGPGLPDGTSINGKVGGDLTLEQGYEAARRCGINQLSVLKAHLGDLNRVKKVVKVLGMVNCPSDFTDQSKVINGFSDLMVEVFGESGKHARSAVGMGSLPSNIAVEIEAIVEIHE